jgi:hypothetical protein
MFLFSHLFFNKTYQWSLILSRDVAPELANDDDAGHSNSAGTLAPRYLIGSRPAAAGSIYGGLWASCRARALCVLARCPRPTPGGPSPLCAQCAHINGTVDKDCSVALALALAMATPSVPSPHPRTVKQATKPRTRTGAQPLPPPSSIAHSG